ncbi:MAG: hypothetical protein E7K85_12210 [Clostridium sp.]|nr:MULTISPECIES: hypothetical protein [Clostridium]MDB2121516.1 hypothetical protein [Clostridium paraputrificum]MDU2755496.1 hypothetical protein [Clostridium sp.]MDU2901063.1 hypothetical protein [Clostridium sp.]MDU4426758.1 hypothetical protein [Clostridium sp.]MDU7461383.1 hypothetical protein [Clostridium sp.]
MSSMLPIGIIYDSGECPTVGSILYVIFALINSWLFSWILQVVK